MLSPATATDPLAQLRAHASQALQLLDKVTIQAHPAASLTSRRRANQASYALQSARRELQRLVGLLERR
jgi:hypothetical protein